MDVTYNLFRRLVVHWHQSSNEADTETTRLSGPEAHARRLIAQCGRSWKSNSLEFEADPILIEARPKT